MDDFAEVDVLVYEVEFVGVDNPWCLISALLSDGTAAVIYQAPAMIGRYLHGVLRAHEDANELALLPQTIPVTDIRHFFKEFCEVSKDMLR